MNNPHSFRLQANPLPDEKRERLPLTALLCMAFIIGGKVVEQQEASAESDGTPIRLMFEMPPGYYLHADDFKSMADGLEMGENIEANVDGRPKAVVDLRSYASNQSGGHLNTEFVVKNLITDGKVFVNLVCGIGSDDN